VQAVHTGAALDLKGIGTRNLAADPVLARLNFVAPDRRPLVPLEHYAKLDYKGEHRLVGYVEASRGCLHQCTHCPIPSVYKGRFFVIPDDIVLEDIRGLVAAGARHITFGDPDFLNGPGHSFRITRAMHEEFPDLSFDFTAKVEHILKHRAFIPQFAQTGCNFVVSAVESLSDTVLERLDKGHTRNDVIEALRIVRAAGIALRPTFVAFTPWTTIDDYIQVLEFVESEDLIDHVDPVQYSIRLLVPPGSLLLSQPDRHQWLGQLVQESLSYEWSHTDPRMDELQRRVSALVEQAAARNEDAAETFYTILELAHEARGRAVEGGLAVRIDPLRIRPPRLTEAWFC
jgi:tRNA A37 methylthiotransferase MiaB